jgi:hypothetical protein
MKRTLTYLLAPALMVLIGAVLMTVFDSKFGAWIALAGFVAVAVFSLAASWFDDLL